MSAFDRPRQLAPILWILLGLFCLRVAGQALVAFCRVEFLPPMPEWYFGFAYLAAMVARYPLHMYFHAEARWFGGTIPIFFHWVLAAFVILVGLHHRRRLGT